MKKNSWKKIAISALFVINSSLNMVLGSEEDKKAMSKYYRVAYEQNL